MNTLVINCEYQSSRQMERFCSMLETETLVDCFIKVEGQIIKVHKMIMAASSPYFETLLTEVFEGTAMIFLHDIKCLHLKYIIQFIYGGRVSVPAAESDEFFKVAHTLQITGIPENNSAADLHENIPLKLESVGNSKQDGMPVIIDVQSVRPAAAQKAPVSSSMISIGDVTIPASLSISLRSVPDLPTVLAVSSTNNPTKCSTIPVPESNLPTIPGPAVGTTTQYDTSTTKRSASSTSARTSIILRSSTSTTTGIASSETHSTTSAATSPATTKFSGSSTSDSLGSEPTVPITTSLCSSPSSHADAGFSSPDELAVPGTSFETSSNLPTARTPVDCKPFTGPVMLRYPIVPLVRVDEYRVGRDAPSSLPSCASTPLNTERPAISPSCTPPATATVDPQDSTSTPEEVPNAATHSPGYFCSICSKTFPSELSARRHLASHGNVERPFKCQICNRAFRYEQALRKHLQVHTGDKSHKCPVCGKGFAVAIELRRHVRSHKAGRILRCRECGRHFTKRILLEMHVCSAVTVQTSLRCSICNRLFRRAKNLQTHLKMHSGERPFKCKLCPKDFALSSSLSKHVSRIHYNGRVQGQESG